MKPICLMIERTSARCLLSGRAPSPRIEAHLKRCPQCRESQRDLDDLIQRLAANQLPCAESNRFSEQIWNRVQEYSATAHGIHAHALRPAVVLALAATLLIITLRTGPFYRTDLEQRYGSKFVNPPRLARIDTNAKIPAHAIDKKERAGSSKTAKSSQLGQGLGKSTPTQAKSRKRHRRQLTKGKTMMALGNMKGLDPRAQAKPLFVMDPVLAWSRWGQYFESNGDFHAAEAAYAMALDGSSDPSLVFSAGRAAECAGDIAQAVDYYSRMLKLVPQDAQQPKKGTMLWTEKFETA